MYSIKYLYLFNNAFILSSYILNHILQNIIKLYYIQYYKNLIC